MDHRSKCKRQNCKTVEGNIRENLDDFGFVDDTLDTTPKA